MQLHRENAIGDSPKPVSPLRLRRRRIVNRPVYLESRCSLDRNRPKKQVNFIVINEVETWPNVKPVKLTGLFLAGSAGSAFCYDDATSNRHGNCGRTAKKSSQQVAAVGLWYSCGTASFVAHLV